MWIARFRVWHRQSSALFTKEKDVEYVGYFLNTFRKGGKLFLNRLAIISGSDSSYLIEKMKNEKWLQVKWVEGNVMLFSHEVGNSFHTLFSDGTVFFVKPLVARGGFEYWEVASWDKKHINALYQRVKKVGRQKATIDLLELKNRPLSEFFMLAHASLTPKQLEVLKKACTEGYYELPRKISLEKLAGKIGEPRTTLQDKIRRAEKALIPKIVEELAK